MMSSRCRHHTTTLYDTTTYTYTYQMSDYSGANAIKAQRNKASWSEGDQVRYGVELYVRSFLTYIPQS